MDLLFKASEKNIVPTFSFFPNVIVISLSPVPAPSPASSPTPAYEPEPEEFPPFFGVK